HHAAERENLAFSLWIQVRQQIVAPAWMQRVITDEGYVDGRTVDGRERLGAVVKARSGGAGTKKGLPRDGKIACSAGKIARTDAAGHGDVDAKQLRHRLDQLRVSAQTESTLTGVGDTGDHDLIAHTWRSLQEPAQALPQTQIDGPVQVATQKEEI